MPQGEIQAAVRAITGTAYDLNGDFHALFDMASIPAGDFNGRMLAWINSQLGTSFPDLNGAMSAYATIQGATNFWAMSGIGSGALDRLGIPAAVAFSTRKLRTAYLGSCLRVRRSYDNAELDIPFKLYAGRADPYWLDEDLALGFVGGENRIRNAYGNGAVNGVLGAGGALPTNWGFFNFNGCTRTLTDLGLQTVGNTQARVFELSVVGTTTDANGGQLFFEQNGAVSAANGQTWTNSCFVALVSGSIPGGNIRLEIRERSDVAMLIDAASSPLALTPTLARFEFSRTNSQAGTTNIVPRINFSLGTPGVAVNFTIRFAIPQLEQRASASRPLATTGMASTSIGSGFVSVWYGQTGGNNLVQATATSQPRIVNAGVLETVNGLPAIFTPAGTSMSTGVAPWLVTGNADRALNAVMTRQSGGTMAVWSGQHSANGAWGVDVGSPTLFAPYTYGVGDTTSAGVALNTPSIVTASRSAGVSSGFLNGSARSTNSNAINTVATNGLGIGTRPDNASSIGWYSEILYFTGALSASSRQALERNQGAAFNITVA